MTRGRDPVRDDALEIPGADIGMCRHHQFYEAALSCLCKCLHVTVQDSLEGLLLFPLRMLRCERLDLIKRKDKLRVHRLFDPQRSIIVEGRSALGDRDKTW